MPAYKLAVGNTVEVPIRLTLRDAGQDRNFKFTLLCERVPADDITKAMQTKDTPIKEVMAELVKGWEGQKLVLEEDGTPAEFSAEAFDLMMSIPVVPLTVFNAYLKECGAKSKN